MIKRGFLVLVALFLIVGLASAYNLGPLIDQGFNTYLNDSHQEVDDPVYQDILDSYQLAGLNEEDLQADIQNFVEAGQVTNEESSSNANTNVKKVSVEEADRETEKKNAKNKIKWNTDGEKGEGFWTKFVNWIDGIKKSITGNAIVNEYVSEDLVLPELPELPGDVDSVVASQNNLKLFSFITGNAILNVPEWAKNGDEQEAIKFEARLTKTDGASQIHHFDIKVANDLELISLPTGGEITNFSRGVTYSKGYYLNEKQGQWKEFGFDGLRIRQTDWLLDSASGRTEEGDFRANTYFAEASLNLNDYTDNDYAIFLVYACRKPIDDTPWKCNDGKWTLFVVNTGSINYHVPSEDNPLQYTENRDANLADIPSLLTQLGVSALDVQPRLDDALLIAPETAYSYGTNEIGNLEFLVANLGNKKLDNIKYELDIGEQSLVDVISVDVPKSLEIGQTGTGTISLKFKERGKWRFPLSVVPTGAEVDASDNYLTFNVTVGEPITLKTATDSIDEEWNREINYTVKEHYSKTNIANDGENTFYIVSGTDKIRTVFGDFRGAAPEERPRAIIHFQGVVSREAISKQFFASAFYIGMEPTAGDREIIEYYMEITDNSTGQVYTSPLMESNYKYYYKPKELIPDFAFCKTYIAKTVIANNVYDDLLFEDPKPVTFKDSTCSGGTGIKTQESYFRLSLKRKMAIDFNNYLAVAGTVTKNRDLAIETLGTVFDAQMGQPIPVGTVKLFPLNLSNEQLKTGVLITKRATFPEAQPEVKPSLYDALTGTNPVATISWSDYNKIYVNTLAQVFVKDEIINLTFVGGGAGASAIKDWVTEGGVAWKGKYPEYMDWDLREFLDNESEFEIVVYDLNTDSEVARFIQKGVKIAGARRKTGANEQQLYTLALSASLTPVDQKNLIHGHYYQLTARPIGELSHFYAPVIPPAVLFYIDGYQMVANNPLFRTRFLNMENSPFSVASALYDGKPRIYFGYETKNLRYDPDSGKIEKIDTSNREIKLNDIFGMKIDIFENAKNPRKQIFDRANYGKEYINDGETIDPLFEGLSMEIIPLSSLTDGDRRAISTRKSTGFFNCKIGRYDMICNRHSEGYDIVYIDEVNSIMYRIALRVPKLASNLKPAYENLAQRDVAGRLQGYDINRFIKQNRDNPYLYDAVIYDILSEIDRNPVISDFSLQREFDKPLIERPDVVNMLFETIAYNDIPTSQNCEEIPSEKEDFYSERGDYPVMSYIGTSGSARWAKSNTAYETTYVYPYGQKIMWSDIKRADSQYGPTYLVDNENNQLPLSSNAYAKAARDTPDPISINYTERLSIYSIHAEVFNFDDKEIVADEEFNFPEGKPLYLANDEISKWVHTLNLVDGKRYSISTKVTDSNFPNLKIADFPIVFTHRSDYTKVITEDNARYVKSIDELKSTVVGVIPNYNCVDKGALNGADFLAKNIAGIGPVYEPASSNRFIRNNLLPNQLLYDRWHSDEFVGKGPYFVARFVADPKLISEDYPGEAITKEELLDNLYGERRNELVSNKAYVFNVYKFTNIYDYFASSPTNNLNTLDTDLTGVICFGSKQIWDGRNEEYRSNEEKFRTDFFSLFCRWGNIDSLELYDLTITMSLEPDQKQSVAPGSGAVKFTQKGEDDMREYAETVLGKYLEWHIPTPILNTTFESYSKAPN